RVRPTYDRDGRPASAALGGRDAAVSRHLEASKTDCSFDMSRAMRMSWRMFTIKVPFSRSWVRSWAGSKPLTLLALQPQERVPIPYSRTTPGYWSFWPAPWRFGSLFNLQLSSGDLSVGF